MPNASILTVALLSAPVALWWYAQSLRRQSGAMPRHFAAAQKLAQSIAHKANCSHFEYFDAKSGYAIFTCSKKELNHVEVFVIWVFYTEEARSQVLIDLKSDGYAFKISRNFAISKFTEEGQVIRPSDFSRFPGDTINPRRASSRKSADNPTTIMSW